MVFFFGFSRLLLYEMYIPRNFKLIENFYKNIDEFHFQNHLRSLWRVSKKLKSKSNVKFLCGKKLYKKIKIKSLPRYIDIIERTDLPCNYGEIVENF